MIQQQPCVSELTGSISMRLHALIGLGGTRECGGCGVSMQTSSYSDPSLQSKMPAHSSNRVNSRTADNDGSEDGDDEAGWDALATVMRVLVSVSVSVLAVQFEWVLVEFAQMRLGMSPRAPHPPKQVISSRHHHVITTRTACPRAPPSQDQIDKSKTTHTRAKGTAYRTHKSRGHCTPAYKSKGHCIPSRKSKKWFQHQRRGAVLTTRRLVMTWCRTGDGQTARQVSEMGEGAQAAN
ncbi:hypothetical protein BJ741DRAFT_581226 [Chytriomyces cf. hyalinus JEL632]|nr:hypothetical protein BJ741DRAFT_581226 [Chytriomyces cf. hyalinus JEL632]